MSPQGPPATPAAPFVASDFDVVVAAGMQHRRYWRNAWEARGLFYYLAWRDLRVRYKQTAIGIAWGLLKPLLSMLVFTFIFGKIAGLTPRGATTYHTMVFAGLLPWQLFSTAVLHSSGSLTLNAPLITKVYFPRLILPASAIVNGLVDFGIATMVLLAMMLFEGVAPSWRALTLPLFAALALLPAFGLGVWLAALNVRYRDFTYLVPFLLQLGGFVSPVGFDSVTVPENLRVLFALNPMVGIIDGVRWALFGADVDPRTILMSLGVSVVLIALGVRHFRRTEAGFADQI